MSDLQELYLVGVSKLPKPLSNREIARQAIDQYNEKKFSLSRMERIEQINDLQPNDLSNAEMIDFIYSSQSPYYSAYDRARAVMALQSGK